MFKNLLISIFCFIAILSSQNSFGQEVSAERTTEYTLSLNSIKHQSQVDNVTLETEALKNINYCKLDWLNYTLTIKVKEGGTFGFLSMEEVKKILIKNGVSLVKFTKKEVK